MSSFDLWNGISRRLRLNSVISMAQIGDRDVEIITPIVRLDGTAVPAERPQRTPIDRSSVTAVGGVAQVLLVARAERRHFSIQNLSSGDLWVSMAGAASMAPGSHKIPPGGYFESPDGMSVAAQISVIGAAAGQAFTAMEW